MLYTSELTGQSYKTEKECKEADKKLIAEREAAKEKEEKLKNERAERAKEIEEARAKVVEAEKHYRELIKKFAEDYDSYHYSITRKDINGIFDEMFRFF